MNDANAETEETDAGAEPNPLATEECAAEQSTDALMATEEYQYKIVNGIANGIDKYFQQIE